MSSHIRNFSIIAHIDHGKSTLADRLLERCNALSERQKTDQFLDKMELERERGITIKAQTIRLDFTAEDGERYQLNLIDTPGHVDFQYEVSRSLQACEGALLIVDATQGVEAQTVSNVYLAVDANLEIIPVLNKMDLASADPDRVKAQIEEVLGIDASEAIAVSAKTGEGVDDVLNAIVKHVPPPEDKKEEPLAALIFDSWYDSFRGVVMLVRVKEGCVKKGDKVHLCATGGSYEVQDLAIFAPNPTSVPELTSGDVGLILSGVKDIRDAQIGDTVTHSDRRCETPLAGFRPAKPVVFAGLYPTDSGAYGNLRDALEKLALNDASFTFEPENSLALGFGFRCGFLGLLHMEVIQERLEREYDIDLIVTAPAVAYHCYLKTGEKLVLENPSALPEVGDIERIEEPYILGTIHLPPEYLGGVFKLCEDKRGTQHSMNYPTPERAVLEYHLPLAEVVTDFYDKLKSTSRGYASLDYELSAFKANDLVKVDVMINGDPVDALATICHRDDAYHRGQELCKKLKELIPRQMFEVAIQAAIGSRVISRTNVKALRKNVTAKCYGGDISRKRKLLEKQKAGKKRMKQVGSVEIPQDAFLAVLKLDT